MKTTIIPVKPCILTSKSDFTTEAGQPGESPRAVLLPVLHGMRTSLSQVLRRSCSAAQDTKHFITARLRSAGNFTVLPFPRNAAPEAPG